MVRLRAYLPYTYMYFLVMIYCLQLQSHINTKHVRKCLCSQYRLWSSLTHGIYTSYTTLDTTYYMNDHHHLSLFIIVQAKMWSQGNTATDPGRSDWVTGVWSLPPVGSRTAVQTLDFRNQRQPTCLQLKPPGHGTHSNAQYIHAVDSSNP